MYGKAGGVQSKTQAGSCTCGRVPRQIGMLQLLFWPLAPTVMTREFFEGVDSIKGRL